MTPRARIHVSLRKTRQLNIKVLIERSIELIVILSELKDKVLAIGFDIPSMGAITVEADKLKATGGDATKRAEAFSKLTEVAKDNNTVVMPI